MTPPRQPRRRPRGARHARWLTACALLLTVLLPLQGIALSLADAWRPAHVHVHRQGDNHALPASSRLQDAPAATAALADDAILDYLPHAGRGHAHDADGNDLLPDGALGADEHQRIGHHRHALDDPDVVYVGDDGRTPDGASAGLGKIASDGMVMLLPTWPQPIAVRGHHPPHPAAMPAYADRRSVPPDRPPA